MPDLLVTAHAELTAWQPPDDQAAERARYLALLAAVGEGALFKELGDTHLTASTFVFSPDLGQVLLTLHQQDPALSIPDGVQIWQVRDVQAFGSLLAAQQAPFPDAYALAGVIPGSDLEEAFNRAQHSAIRIPGKGLIEDGLDWRDRHEPQA